MLATALLAALAPTALAQRQGAPPPAATGTDVPTMINGPTGRHNPQRQGLNSALLDHLDPLHVIGGIPTLALDYSPL